MTGASCAPRAAISIRSCSAGSSRKPVPTGRPQAAASVRAVSTLTLASTLASAIPVEVERGPAGSGEQRRAAGEQSDLTGGRSAGREHVDQPLGEPGCGSGGGARAHAEHHPGRRRGRRGPPDDGERTPRSGRQPDPGSLVRIPVQTPARCAVRPRRDFIAAVTSDRR